MKSNAKPMKSMSKGGGKTTTAGRGTIKTAFSKAVVRNIGRKR